ncbi:MAG: class I SAM-dependent methyltransferase, partial [Deltaproteobacteria bacterium]|nr:class I SAM-dependent methyltransferase [Deltaproteobacteria bacterium]
MDAHALAVTTANKPHPGDEAAARAFAASEGLPFAPRRHKESLETLLARCPLVLVHARNGLTLWTRTGSLHWSPGVAQLRLKRFEAGARDDLVLRHGELGPGDSVLDATLGQAQDALLAARAVGPSGKVLGVESSLPLYLLAREGLRRFDVGPGAAPLEIRRGRSGDVLASLPTGSVDVVLWDPMFERPRKAQPGFEVLREVADSAPLTPELLAESRRVARRWVLVKASRYSSDLRKLGLLPLP